MKFRVGDIITGNNGSNKYSYTTSKATMVVVDVSKHDIDVKIIAHETLKGCIGKAYLVDPKHFVLLGPSKGGNYIEMEEE